MIKKALSILLILLTGIIILNKASFSHTHITADGSVITHAHPYNKAASDPEGSHEHTKWEFAFFQVFDAFYPVITLSLSLLLLFSIKKFFIENDNNLISVIASNPTGRAPPYVSI